MPIYVVHNEYFENEVIIFRHGMSGLYSISRKRMGVGMDLMPCQSNEFPVTNVATDLNVLDKLMGNVNFLFMCTSTKMCDAKSKIIC